MVRTPVSKTGYGGSNPSYPARVFRTFAGRAPQEQEDQMATRTVKMSSEESQGGPRSELQKKVTGTVTDTREFLHDVRVEMKQVTWPSRDDVVSTTAVVIATVAFFGIFLAIVERIAQWGLDRLLSYFHA